MNKKKNLLKLFSQNKEYYFYIEEKEIGHLIYVSKEKTEYNTDTLEFKVNSIIEGFLNELSITFEKVAPSVYFTEEKNIKKLKYELGEEFKESTTFNSFIEEIKEKYFQDEIGDFLIYKSDPEAYEKKKNDEYKKHQSELYNKLMEQQKESEKKRKDLINEYDNDIIKIFKDVLLPTIIFEEKDFKLNTQLSKFIFSLIEKDEKWAKRDGHFIMGNEKFEPIQIENDTITILIKDRMSIPFVITLKLSGSELEIIDVIQKDSNTMTDYDFLMKIFNIVNDFNDWISMHDSEKLLAVVDKIIKLEKKEKEKREKEKEEIIDSSHAKAFFTIDNYEINLSTLPGIITKVKNKLFKPVETILDEFDIDYQRGEHNIEFIETINYKKIEKIYNYLIEHNYMLDVDYMSDEDILLPFMNSKKPDTSKFTIYVGWLDKEDIYENKNDTHFSFYTSHKTPIVYDQQVSWIDVRIEKLLTQIENDDITIDIGAAENYHLVYIKNKKNKKETKKLINSTINNIKNIVNKTDGFEWFDK